MPTSAATDCLQLEQDLVCFTHLRWHWMASRYQQSFVRTAHERRVFMVEEPVFVPGAPCMDVEIPHHNLTVARPCLPYTLLGTGVVQPQRRLLDSWLASMHVTPGIVWYHSPAAFAHSAHLGASVTVYDRVTDPSPLPDDRLDAARLERDLLERANVVYAESGVHYERMRELHPDVRTMPADGGIAAFMEALRVTLREAPTASLTSAVRSSVVESSRRGASRTTTLPGDRPCEERADHLQVARLEPRAQRRGIWEEPRLERGP